MCNTNCDQAERMRKSCVRMRKSCCTCCTYREYVGCLYMMTSFSHFLTFIRNIRRVLHKDKPNVLHMICFQVLSLKRTEGSDSRKTYYVSPRRGIRFVFAPVSDRSLSLSLSLSLSVCHFIPSFWNNSATVREGVTKFEMPRQKLLKNVCFYL